MLLVTDGVTPITQVVSFTIVGSIFTLVTLLINNHNKNRMEIARLQEKVDDRNAAIEKETRDYARQDEISSRVAEATKATLTKLSDVEKLGQVTHALVNSDKTTAMKDRRDELLVTIALMKEIIEMKKNAGGVPTDAAVAAVETMAGQIVSLEAAINDRLKQQEIAEASVELQGGISSTKVNPAALAEVVVKEPKQ